MSKFDKKTPAGPKGAVQVVDESPTVTTHEGAPAFKRDAKSELFLLAVVNMVGEDTFYEAGGERDARFRDLIHEVVQQDPEWIARFVPFLRNEMHMRSASLVMAAEYVKAGGPNGRGVIASAMSRADEPAETLAYWSHAHGRNFPMPLKRGVADAAVRLYNEFSALKYDGASRNWRMGDVIDLAHPKPKDAAQSALFRWLLDARHNRPDAKVVESLADDKRLEVIASVLSWDRLSTDVVRDNLLRGVDLPKGVTWERLSGKTKMDAAAWEAVIPQMGYMALLRNLRNFDEAERREGKGVSTAVADKIIAKLSDPDEVARSRQLPIRFFSAFRNVASERWSAALETALDLSLQNVPTFPGRTLILVDVSGSMQSGGFGRRSTVTPGQLAALFGGAVAKRSEDATLVAFGTTSSEETEMLKRNSLLKLTEKLHQVGQRVGYGTNMLPAIREHFKGHDRVLLFTDMQIFPDTGRGGYGLYHDYTPLAEGLPRDIKRLYGFNLGGYEAVPFRMGRAGAYEFGGLNDRGFQMLKLLESGRDVGWPF